MKMSEIEILNVKFGKNVHIVKPSNIYGSELGDDVFVGPFVEIQKNTKIGNATRIQSHTFVCELVEIGSKCFIGHGVMFVNDKFNIIGDYTSNFKKNDLDHWINSLFKNDHTHYSNDLIHQYLYKNLFLEKNDVNDIVDIVSKSLEKEISVRVKNILPRIRKNNFTMKDFENTLDSILSSVGKLNSTICIIDKFRNKYFDCSEFKKYY